MFSPRTKTRIARGGAWATRVNLGLVMLTVWTSTQGPIARIHSDEQDIYLKKKKKKAKEKGSVGARCERESSSSLGGQGKSTSP